MALRVDPTSTPDEHSNLALSLLGPFQASCDDQPVSFATDATRGLLAYLAVEAGRPHRREYLATMLWPDHSQSAALTNLRQTLARLRKGLSEPVASKVLEVTRRTLAVDPDRVDLDCAQFESLIAACADHAHSDIARCRACIQRLEQACVLYRGDFLDGVFSGSSQLFDEWGVSRREHFHRQALDALQTLTAHYELVADFEAMRQCAARQLQFDPWREEAHRQTMLALALLGQRTEALDQYESCRRILTTELGIEPDTETRSLYERIRDDDLEPEKLQAPAPVHNLPAQLTPFIGREREVKDTHALLDNPDVRLVTLVGAGGMGKTRLAIEAASRRLNRHPDGVFFVSLAPLTRPDAIASAIATAMGFTQTSDVRQQLPFALRDKQALLILDNFEHLLDGVGDVVELLEAAPDLQVIATSRERLNMLGEHAYVVQGMEYGKADNHDAQSASASRLFAQSVRRVCPDFALRDENLSDVTRICDLVEGMPLGLELAAAWADMLSLDEIAQEIERSIDFLRSDWRDTPQRHRSLRAVFESSWRSLDESERQAFRRLSVFRGGFTRSAAQAVTGASLRALARLAHKSLLHQQGGRYQIHELLRQFGAEQLDSSPDERLNVEQRHSAYYQGFVAQRQAALDGGEPQRPAAQIQTEIDNIEKAWMSAVQHDLIKDLDESAIGLWRFFSLAGSSVDLERLMHLAAEHLETFLTRGDTDGQADNRDYEVLLSKLRAMQAAALVSQGEHDPAIPIAAQAIGLGHASRGVEGEVFGYLSKGQALAQKAQYAESQFCLKQALSHAQRSLSGGSGIDSLHLIEYLVDLWLGAIANRQNEYARAGQLFRRGLDICRRRSDLRGEMHSLANLANAARTVHDYSSAREHYENALRIARRLGYRWGEATTQQELGDVARLQGDPASALVLTEQSLIVSREIGDRLREAVSLAYLGRLHAYLGDDAGSREYLERFRHISDGIDAPLAENWGSLAFAVQHYHAGEAEQALAYAQRAVSAAQSVGSGVDQADALVVTGQILACLNRPAEATSAFEHAITLCDDVDSASEVVTARAGLALIALSQLDSEEALAHVETILATMAQYPDRHGDRPFAVYLACYRVLETLDDPRAIHVLQEAHCKLLEYADKITDTSLRRSFLENVTAHRELQQAWTAHAEASSTELESARPAPIE